MDRRISSMCIPSHVRCALCPFPSLIGQGGSSHGPTVEESPGVPPRVKPDVPLRCEALLDVATTAAEILDSLSASPYRGTHANEVSVLWTAVSDVRIAAHVGLESEAKPVVSLL